MFDGAFGSGSQTHEVGGVTIGRTHGTLGFQPPLGNDEEIGRTNGTLGFHPPLGDDEEIG